MKTRTAKSYVYSCLILLMGVLMIASMFLKVYSFTIQKGEAFVITQSGFEVMFSTHAEVGSAGIYASILAWMNLIFGVAAIVIALLDMVVFGESALTNLLHTVALVGCLVISVGYALAAYMIADVLGVRDSFIWDASLSFVSFLGVFAVSFVYALISFFGKKRA